MADSSIRIRTAGPEDSGLLARLGARTFCDTFGSDNTPEDMAAYLAQAFGPEKQAAELAQPGSTFLIAEALGGVVGYARLRQAPGPEYIRAVRPLEIVRLYATAAWIGRGVGAALMRSCLDHARQQGCEVIWLDVWERNARAIAFYKRWGFAEVGTQAFALGADMQRDLLMARAVENDDAVAKPRP